MPTSSVTAPGGTEEPRFTWGFVIAVFDVLEKHGFRRGDDQHVGRALGQLTKLVGTYEGRDGEPEAGA